ncbi:MAG: GntR family transcriptional regulator [Oscillospiraceae bacterium]|jgi:DNA-binding transcriptional regulator YhcF (GntR family)|nr:GntR family transcriptional regulator [Oscillospiraceae bacterium]
MEFSFDADRPIYIQLKERVKIKIVSGEYPPGSQIPTVRELAEQSSVNPNTMQKALSELERDGLLFAQRTSGRFVTEDAGLVENLKKELAGTEISRFLKVMASIGIPPDEAAGLITATKEEE